MIKNTACAIVLVFAPLAFGQTYIVPAGDCGTATFHVARGSHFPELRETVTADRVREASVILPKRRLAAELVEGPRSLTFDAEVPSEGVVMAAVELKPEVSANETRRTQAKAFIFCGAVTPTADWQRSAGLSVEIIPQGWNGPRPQLRPGDPMRFIVVDRATNKIVRDAPMQLHRAGAGRIAEGAPAEHGGMTFPYQEPGRYMVVATYRRPDAEQPGNWLVDTTTLTFDIK